MGDVKTMKLLTLFGNSSASAATVWVTAMMLFQSCRELITEWRRLELAVVAVVVFVAKLIFVVKILKVFTLDTVLFDIWNDRENDGVYNVVAIASLIVAYTLPFKWHGWYRIHMIVSLLLTCARAA